MDAAPTPVRGDPAAASPSPGSILREPPVPGNKATRGERRCALSEGSPRFLTNGGESSEGTAARFACRPHFEFEVVDQPVPGAARRAGLYPAGDDAPHGASRDRPCLGPMPHPSATAAQDRRGGHPKYAHRRGPALQRLPRPSRVPAARAKQEKGAISRPGHSRPVARRASSRNSPER